MHCTDKPYLNGSNIGIAVEELIKTIWMKYGQHIKVDILIIGGSALALKYNLRGTCDIDAELRGSNIMFSECISETCRRVPGLERDFVNSDFMKSYSYSRHLWNFVILFKSYNNVNVYVVNDIAQLVMKMVSGRRKDIKDAKFLAMKVIEQGFFWADVLNVHQILYGNSIGTEMKPIMTTNIGKIFKKYKRL